MLKLLHNFSPQRNASAANFSKHGPRSPPGTRSSPSSPPSRRCIARRNYARSLFLAWHLHRLLSSRPTATGRLVGVDRWWHTIQIRSVRLSMYEVLHMPCRYSYPHQGPTTRSSRNKWCENADLRLLYCCRVRPTNKQFGWVGWSECLVGTYGDGILSAIWDGRSVSGCRGWGVWCCRQDGI